MTIEYYYTIFTDVGLPILLMASASIATYYITTRSIKKDREQRVRFLCMKIKITEDEWLELLAIASTYYNCDFENCQPSMKTTDAQQIMWQAIKEQL